MPYPNGSQWGCDKCGTPYNDWSGAVACEDRNKAQEDDLKQARENGQP